MQQVGQSAVILTSIADEAIVFWMPVPLKSSAIAGAI